MGLDRRVTDIELLLEGTQYNRGFVQEMRDEVKRMETDLRENRKLVALYHEENSHRLDKILGRFRLAVILLIGVMIGLSFGGWKLNSIDAAIKAAAIIAK